MKKIFFLMTWLLPFQYNYAKEYLFSELSFNYSSVSHPQIERSKKSIKISLPNGAQKILADDFPGYRLPKNSDINKASEWAADLSLENGAVGFVGSYDKKESKPQSFIIFAVSKTNPKKWVSIYFDSQKGKKLEGFLIEEISAITPDLYAIHANGSWSYGREGTHQLSLKFDGKRVSLVLEDPDA